MVEEHNMTAAIEYNVNCLSTVWLAYFDLLGIKQDQKNALNLVFENFEKQ
jgi:hypothetical protein